MDDKVERDVSERSWFAWSNHVLKELETNTKCHAEIKSDLTDIKIAVAQLKVKSGMWGAIGGAIPVLIGLALWLIKR